MSEEKLEAEKKIEKVKKPLTGRAGLSCDERGRIK
jgi:hypothetical protein